MAREPRCTLTPAQAKAHFRTAAHRASLAGWVDDHPWHATLAAFTAGLAVGGVRRVGDTFSGLLFALLPTLFR